MRGKARRTHCDDVYISDLGYSQENPYDELPFELPIDHVVDFKDENYSQFVDSRIGHFNRTKLPQDTRYNYTRGPGSLLASNNRAYRRENISPQRWFTESDERNFREDIDIRSRGPSERNEPRFFGLSERKKRTKTLSRTDDNFNCKTSTFLKNRWNNNF